MGKARQIFSEIEKIKDRKTGRIIVLTGARQVGKTYLVKKLLSDYRYISIEDPVLRAGYTTLSADQWHSLYPKAALDEVQKEPQVIESIKSVYDQFDDTRYILLGSSQLLLMNKVKESLAGRCTIFDMYPLTLPELRTADCRETAPLSLWQKMLNGEAGAEDILPSFLMDGEHSPKAAAWEYFLKFGGYPALTDEEADDEERYRWLSGYVRTYLERDVRDLASFRDLEPFVRLQREVAVLNGQIYNASAVSNSIRVDSKTAQRYLTYLEMSYQEIILQAWSRNTEKRLTKAPKIHFMDFGVQQAVLNKRGGITGHEFESIVISELYKQSKNILCNASFYHLRTQDGREVDLLVETSGGYYAFEVKMSENVTESDARHLKKLDEYLDKPVLAAFVVSNDPVTKRLGSGVVAVNAAMLLG